MSNLDPRQTALNAIFEEAQKLLEKNLPIEIRDVIERIVSIARYESDIRNAEEQIASRI